MGELLIRRREMMIAGEAPNPLPSGYTRIEYIERPTSADASSGYNTLFMLNGTDPVVIHIGLMLIKKPSSSDGVFLGCRRDNSGNYVGFEVYASQSCTSLGVYDGTDCTIQPNGGSSILDIKYDVVVTRTKTGSQTELTITDGTNSNAASGTPRAIADALRIFGVKKYNSNQSFLPVWGRIYYLKIWEGGVLKTDLIPCTRNSDSRNGFWDVPAETFRDSATYVAGPTV